MTSEGTNTNPTNARSDFGAWLVERLQAHEQLIRENQRKTEEGQKRLEDLLMGLVGRLTPPATETQNALPVNPYVPRLPENPYGYPTMGQIHIPDSANPPCKRPVFAFPPPYSGGGVPIFLGSSSSVTPTTVRGEGFTSVKDFEELKDMVLKLAHKESFDFEMPDVEKFDGLGCPKAHIRSYSSAMIYRGATTEAMAANFHLTLVGAAKEWFMSLEPTEIATWQKITDLFYKRYQGNNWRFRKRELVTFPQKDDESFTDYAARWREKVAKTLDRPDDEEQVKMFLKNLLPVYAEQMKYLPYESFRSVINVGLSIEEDIRLGYEDVETADRKIVPAEGPQKIWYVT